MKIINIALPVAMREQGNQFARCIGMGPEDDRTFSHGPNAQDADGNLYIFTNGWVVPHFAEIAMGELVEPEWGCDLDAAQAIPPLIRVGEPAAPDVVAAVFDMDAAAALEVMGLEHIQGAQDEIV